MGARLLLGAGPRPVALRMLGAYLAVTLYADTVYSITVLDGSYRVANYLDAFWIGGSFLFAAALAHPSAPQLGARSSATIPDATPGRLLVLAAAAGAGQRHAAITDGLTGLRSRGFFEQSLRAEAARSARTGERLSMILFDVDHFKSVNDTYGHTAGDRVLADVANRVARVIRPGDLVARYGEEFAVLLPQTTPARPARWPSGSGAASAWSRSRSPTTGYAGSPCRSAWPGCRRPPAPTTW